MTSKVFKFNDDDDDGFSDELVLPNCESTTVGSVKMACPQCRAEWDSETLKRNVDGDKILYQFLPPNHFTKKCSLESCRFSPEDIRSMPAHILTCTAQKSLPCKYCKKNILYSCNDNEIPYVINIHLQYECDQLPCKACGYDSQSKFRYNELRNHFNDHKLIKSIGQEANLILNWSNRDHSKVFSNSNDRKLASEFLECLRSFTYNDFSSVTSSSSSDYCPTSPSFSPTSPSYSPLDDELTHLNNDN